MYPTNLLERTFAFAVAVATNVQRLPETRINGIYIHQLIRCSASVGANYRAAQRAKSTNDFLNKLKIVEEEADECLYFLALLQELNPQYVTLLAPLQKEGTELLRMIVASIKTVRQHKLGT